MAQYVVQLALMGFSNSMAALTPKSKTWKICTMIKLLFNMPTLLGWRLLVFLPGLVSQWRFIIDRWLASVMSEWPFSLQPWINGDVPHSITSQVISEHLSFSKHFHTKTSPRWFCITPCGESGSLSLISGLNSQNRINAVWSEWVQTPAAGLQNLYKSFGKTRNLHLHSSVSTICVFILARTENKVEWTWSIQFVLATCKHTHTFEKIHGEVLNQYLGDRHSL